ncbi:MAG TPA: hypothetical protein VLF69_05895 [Candidatus Saccharimonadales bacterium]|nr:hypothetical protein [Candidatus Saccharimonadales bacterium]
MLSLLLPYLNTFALTCAKPRFLGLAPWDEYLTLRDEGGSCRIVNFDPVSDGTQPGIFSAHSAILLIVLAILNDLIIVAAYVAVGYVIAGGVQYTTSQGAPDATKKAQQTIINALIGLAIALIAASVVAFIGHKLGTS